MSRSSGGQTFSKTCLVRGREAEGRKAILQSKKVNTRVAAIGPDGLSMDGSEKVSTADLVDVRAVDETPVAINALISGVMGERGTITIPAEIRHRLRLQAGSPILIQDDGHKIVIQPAEIRPRAVDSSLALEKLLAEVTPENLHQETSTGEPSGQESW
jgi:antitoxin MazE